jgi:hypothetical protein
MVLEMTSWLCAVIDSCVDKWERGMGGLWGIMRDNEG